MIIIIADKLNTCMPKTTPYQLVFGQPPHSSPFPGTTKYITADTCDVVKEVSADVQGVSGELFLIYASNIIH